MSTYLPIDVQAGLDAARKAARRAANRLRVEVGEHVFPVLRAWEGGFALDPGHAAHLRGRIALFDGSRLLAHGLIVASDEEDGEICCEYKRISDASDSQPLDYARAPDAPVALIGRSPAY